MLHAGGKFGGGGYKVSGGLHGVGASRWSTPCPSGWRCEVQQGRARSIEMKFSRGHITQEMQRHRRHRPAPAPTVTFKPDPEMFDTLEYDYETLHTRMREQAFLNAGLHITIADERHRTGAGATTMCYEGGIREFVTWINRHKTPLHQDVIYMAGTEGRRHGGGRHAV